MQKAYEAVLHREQRGELSGVTIPSTVAFRANAFELNNSLISAFELVRQRTRVLCSYKERLERANAELLNLATTDPLSRACSTAGNLKKSCSTKLPELFVMAHFRCS